jgi:hypothetical protein
VINGSKYGTRPLSSEEALLHLLDQVERSVAAELPFYWVVTDSPGAFMEPTILTDLNPEILHITKNYSDLFPHFTE